MFQITCFNCVFVHMILFMAFTLVAWFVCTCSTHTVKSHIFTSFVLQMCFPMFCTGHFHNCFIYLCPQVVENNIINGCEANWAIKHKAIQINPQKRATTADSGKVGTAWNSYRACEISMWSYRRAVNDWWLLHIWVSNVLQDPWESIQGGPSSLAMDPHLAKVPGGWPVSVGSGG